MPREVLAGLLWSDRGEAQARSSLRQALKGLRKDLAEADESLLSVTDARIGLDLDRVDVDAVAFQRHAASSEVGALRQAAALYRGDFLADTYIRDPAFEEWLARERQRLADLAIKVLEKLSAHETGPARIDIGKRLILLDPLRESSHRLLMQAYWEVGEVALALRQYQLCQELLSNELEVAPGEETEALRLLILSREPVRAGTPQTRTYGQQGHIGDAGLDPEIPSIAILPFDSLGGNPELDLFADALTEDISTDLARIAAIRVIARNTMFAYKHRAVDVRTVGAEVGARYVLEGSTRWSAGRVRVAAQLIEAASGHHIWAERIDRAGFELFDLQDEITQAIVASVQTQMILHEGKVAAAGETERVSRLLARAWQRFLSLSEESLAESKALGERALELDPRSGLGHRMLASALYHQVYMGFVPWTDRVITEVDRHARLSIESDGADEYSHWAMACACLLKKEHERAVASLRRALEINPNCSIAHGAMGTILAWAGEYDASIERNERAISINPRDPSIFFRHFGLALAHYLAGRPHKALGYANLVIQTRPTWWLAQFVCSASLTELGRVPDARRIIDELNRARPRLTRSALELLPFARADDLQRLTDDLVKAGL